MGKIKAQIKNVYHYRFLLTQLVTKSIKLKYRRSYLGILWSLVEPLLTMMVLTFIFTTLLGKGDAYFPVYVLSGRLLFSFFSTGTKTAMRSIRANAAIIKKVYVPKYMYPLSACISSFIISLISLVDLAIVMLIMRMPVNLHIFAAIVPVLILFLLAYGVGMILTTVNVFFRDMEYIWDVISMLIMYTCAIFYKVDTFIGTTTYWVFRINPLYALIKCFRECVYGQPMDLRWLGYALVCSLACCLIGSWIFQRQQNKFIYYI